MLFRGQQAKLKRLIAQKMWISDAPSDVKERIGIDTALSLTGGWLE